MRRILRHPVALMVAAEMVVVAALAAVTWHEVSSVVTPEPPVVVRGPSVPADTAAPDVPADALAPPAISALRLLPGLNVDPAFWRDRLAALNGAEAQLEALEWRIVHSAMDTVRRYVDTVLLPALERAEKRSG
jgi:hypothetical protein